MVLSLCSDVQCERPDSNRDPFRDKLLRLARLPISPRPLSPRRGTAGSSLKYSSMSGDVDRSPETLFPFPRCSRSGSRSALHSQNSFAEHRMSRYMSRNRKPVLATVLALAMVLTGTHLQAQAGSTRGLMVGLQYAGASVSVKEAAEDLKFGSGFGLHAGFGMSDNVAVLVNFDRNVLTRRGDSDDVTISQYDALLRLYRCRCADSPVRLFATAGPPDARHRGRPILMASLHRWCGVHIGLTPNIALTGSALDLRQPDLSAGHHGATRPRVVQVHQCPCAGGRLALPFPVTLPARRVSGKSDAHPRLAESDGPIHPPPSSACWFRVSPGTAPGPGARRSAHISVDMEGISGVNSDNPDRRPPVPNTVVHGS